MTAPGPLAISRQPEEYRERVTVDEHTCSNCGETKPWHQFGMNRGRPTGITNRCLVCERAYQAEWRARQARLAAMAAEEPEEAKSVPVKRQYRRKMDTTALVAQARERTFTQRPEPPEPTPIAGLAALFAMTQTVEEAPVAESSETRLRYELAARMLDQQAELLRLLLAR